MPPKRKRSARDIALSKSRSNRKNSMTSFFDLSWPDKSKRKR